VKCYSDSESFGKVAKLPSWELTVVVDFGPEYYQLEKRWKQIDFEHSKW
jgi:hypothetical protein